jgi:hypothetical protein
MSESVQHENPPNFDTDDPIALFEWILGDREKERPESLFSELKKRGFNQRTLSAAHNLLLLAEKEQPITLRGLFYRAVSSGVYPDTSDPYYDQCGRIVLKLRRKELLPYEWIVDSTRRRLKPSSWSGLDDYAESVAACYRRDLWARQPDYIEFFVEKDAMAAVIEPVTAEYDVHLNVIRGSVSETFAWNIAKEWEQIDKTIFAYYLGDHDPAGLAIENNLEEKVRNFAPNNLIVWQRLAITHDQFEREDLLGFPVKPKVQRKTREQYIAMYGNRCVEIDALPATEIRKLVRDTIEVHIDQAEWRRLQETERLERQSIRDLRLASISSGNGSREDEAR